METALVDIRVVVSLCLAVTPLVGCAPKPVPPSQAREAAPPVESPAVSRPTIPEPYAYRSLRTRGNIRVESSTSSEIVGVLGAGTRVGLLTLKDGWYQVLVDSTTGWVWAPLVDMNLDDRWDAAMSAGKASFPDDSLFTAMYRDDRTLRIILDIAWRDVSRADKEQIVTRTGETWQRAADQMGLKPAPEIRFTSNNSYEMASWHAFWGTRVRH